MATASVLKKAKRMAAKALKNQRMRLKKLADSRLTPEQETEAIYKCKHMYRCLVLLRQKIEEFFVSWGLSPLPEQDTSELLYEMIYHNERIPNFVSSNPNFKENDKKTLLMAIKGRNKLCHGILSVVFREWHSILLAWIEVAKMIGADSLAIEIGKTLNLLSNPFKTNEKPYTVRPSIIFKSLASERTKKWTKSKRAAAICLSNYLYDIFMQEVAPFVTKFVDENEIRDNWTSDMDVHSHTNLLLDNCSMDNFVVPADVKDESELRHLLEKAMNGRHAICHDQYQNVLDNWPIYLKDFVSLLTAIHYPEAAERVQEKLDFLTAKQQKANRIRPRPSPELGSSYRKSLIKKTKQTI